MKTNKTIDGTQFMCEKHGLDYRLLCEECKIRYEQVFKAIKVKRYETKNNLRHA